MNEKRIKTSMQGFNTLLKIVETQHFTSPSRLRRAVPAGAAQGVRRLVCKVNFACEIFFLYLQSRNLQMLLERAQARACLSAREKKWVKVGKNIC